jgi:hypothetical protein
MFQHKINSEIIVLVKLHMQLHGRIVFHCKPYASEGQYKETKKSTLRSLGFDASFPDCGRSPALIRRASNIEIKNSLDTVASLVSRIFSYISDRRLLFIFSA